MLFDISQLGPQGAPLECTVEIPPFPWEGGETVSCEPAAMVGRLTPTRRGVELTAEYTTVVHQRCVRCLAAFDRPLSARFRLFLTPPAGEQGDAECEVLAEDDPDAVDLYPLEGQVVDLAAVLREQVDLALPVRALCRADCRGICSGCGAELNREPCRCARGDDEPRRPLATLRALYEQGKGRGPAERS